MPIIIPPPNQFVGELIAELDRLGGAMKGDYRFTFSEGAAALEVSDELYEKWLTAHNDAQEALNIARPRTATAEDEGEPKALREGRSTVAEHHTHSHTTTLNKHSVAERTYHNYPSQRDFNTITPRTAHDQADGPVVTIPDPTGLSISVKADNGGRPVTITWGDATPDGTNPGDGSTATDHTYAAAGTYTVTVTDAEDPAAATTKQVTVTAPEPPPQAASKTASPGDTAKSTKDSRGGSAAATGESTSSDSDSGTGAADESDQVAATATNDTDPLTGPKRRAPRAKK